MSLELPSGREIEQNVRETVARILRISVDDVAPDAKLGADLGMTSLDYVDLQFSLESEYRVKFYPGSAVERIAELLAPAKLEERGLLTEFGATVLQLRLPEVETGRLQAGEPSGAIEALFTSKTWVRTVRELLATRPDRCRHCQSSTLEVTDPSTLRCRSCKRETTCPDGESCLVEWVETIRPSLATPSVPRGE